MHTSKSPGDDLDADWISQTLRDSAYPTELDAFSKQRKVHQYTKSNSDFELVQKELLIDVTDTCNFNINTGIQRVVRNLVKELVQSNVPHRLVTWNSSETALRELTDLELKVATGIDIALGHDPALGLQDPEHHVKLIPINCKLFIPELATQTKRVQRTICIGRYTSNQLFAIGYDAVPIILPDTTSNGMVSAFALQLEILKNCSAIFGISNATTSEFDALFSGLISQGITPPTVFSVPLPVVGLGGESNNQSLQHNPPRFLVVGSHEPRKNHESILAAAEMLWQDGRDFELHSVGSRGWESDFFWKLVDVLQGRERKLFCHIGISDSELSALYRSSTALVSVSLHEGYGLPVAEAVASNLSVLTVSLGSQGELAKLFSTNVSAGTDAPAIKDAIEKLLREDFSLIQPDTWGSEAKTNVKTWNEYSTQVIEKIASF